MTTSSVSKGCFVFKPASKKQRILSAGDYFHDEDEESASSKLRFETLQSLWQQIKLETDSIQEELNKNILDSLAEFARTSTTFFRSKTDEWTFRMRSSEIPTAALVLGVNVTDHNMTFQNLCELLHQSVTPYVVGLDAKDCPSLKHTLQKLLLHLMGYHLSVEEDEEETQPKANISGIPKKRIQCSIATLCEWYQTVTKDSNVLSPSKKRKSTLGKFGQNPPIVVIFKDLESFTSKVLQDFIIICSQYIHQLPFIFIFGIATSPATVHRMLPHSVSSLLCIELFQSLSCTKHLTTVMDKLILTTSFPFKLNGKALQVLLSIFLFHDFSVRNFIKGLQLSLMEHFYNQPLSVLCCDKHKASKRAQMLSSEECENVRQLPSFMRYVENQEPDEQVKLLTDDHHLKEVVQQLLKQLHLYHKNYYPVLRCLHVLTSSLPKYPLGKQIRELHSMCLERNVWETEEYKSAFQLLRLMAKDELLTAFTKCIEILTYAKGKVINEVQEKLETFVKLFQELDNISLDYKEDDGEDTSPQKGFQQKTDLFHLQKTLLEMKELKKNKKLNKFEMLRLEAIDFIDHIVKKHLLPPEYLALHEVVYYSCSGTLRKHLNAAPRTAIQTALNNPYKYLPNESLQSDGGAISSTAPDICIAYKLHLECGRLINLYDWLEAFATVVSATEGNDTESPVIDDVKHARFIRAVSELEFVGFVKPTKKKTDHVARLTWGGC
ncbi:ORC3 protein, partial [Polypterus senegalus]|nr:ORC3 protein [Polypterus senegalus]